MNPTFADASGRGRLPDQTGPGLPKELRQGQAKGHGRRIQERKKLDNSQTVNVVIRKSARALAKSSRPSLPIW